MRIFLNILNNTFLIFIFSLVLSCKISEYSDSGSYSIGIQMGNKGPLKHEKDLYDFDQDFKYDIFKVKKDNKDVLVFSITNSDWEFSQDGDNREKPKKGIVLFILGNEIEKFKNAVNSGTGEFKAYRNLGKAKDDYSESSDSDQQQNRKKDFAEFKFEKEPSDPEYIFFNAGIFTGNFKDNNKKEYKKASFMFRQTGLQKKLKEAIEVSEDAFKDLDDTDVDE